MSLRVKELLREKNLRVPSTLPSFKDLFSSAAREATNAPVTGMFVCSGSATNAEICAGAGFDYLLIDGEHAPLSLESIQEQLRTIAGYPTLSVVRVPFNDPVLIKQYLDVGVQSLIIPMVHSVEDARAAVSAITYPPKGVRGVGSALARSARWNRIPDYLQESRKTLSLIVQIESQEGVANVEEITTVEGIDALFIGPSDLAASMGYLGQQDHPEVIEAVCRVISLAKKVGVTVGVNAFVKEQAEAYLQAGADFVNIGADVSLLARASEFLATSWKPADDSADRPASY